MGFSKSGKVFLVCSAVSLASLSSAENIWLDWTNAKSQLDIAWSNAGYGAGQALTNAEFDQIRANVKARMEAHWLGFNANFTESNPGGLFETLRLGATGGGSGTYGQAERLDWRNRFKDDIANIYLANFGNIMSSTTYTRAQNLDRIANGIAGTSSHELGHNTGLQHCDCYGQNNINAPGYGGIVGQQNDAIMATGSTGLSSVRRGLPRSFNPHELLKLEFAEGFAPTLGTTINEQVGDHSSIATAQVVNGNWMPISMKAAVNVDGRIATAGQLDYYRFEATAGSLLSGNTYSSFWESDTVDTVVSLYNSAGTLLTSNNNIQFSGNSFNSGVGTYSNDSWVMNYVATYTGTYYFSVAGTGSNSLGDYEFLMSGMNPVPEPATMLALGGGLALLLRRRRKLA